MKILLIEPFMEGSHRAWAQGFTRFSEHDVHILSLPGRHWKWRMYGGAVSLARQFMALDFQPDLLLATDMLDLATFLALTRTKSKAIPCALYFHENQITYPWSPTDADVALQRNNQYGFINYTSALAADAVFFNSKYHLDSFTGALTGFLQQFPDHRELDHVDIIKNKSQVLYLGLDLQKLTAHRVEKKKGPPVLLWNHRWEYDKNPDAFFGAIFKLEEEGIDFRLLVLGAAYRKVPPIFAKAKKSLAAKIIYFAYAQSFEEYASYLWQADILPVSGIQDFFGGSVVESIYCGAYPLLPKRLAYPEHLPVELQQAHFYEQNDEFYPKLRALILNWNKINTSASLQNFVSRYDWSTLAKRYDKVLAKMIFSNY